jgi:hypothetical protein
MTVLFVLLGIAVIAAIGFVAVGRGGDLPEAEPDLTPERIPAGTDEVTALETVRFDVALRGYRMAEVDAVLDRASAALADRDATIADLRARLNEPTSGATA